MNSFSKDLVQCSWATRFAPRASSISMSSWIVSFPGRLLAAGQPREYKAPALTACVLEDTDSLDMRYVQTRLRSDVLRVSKHQQES